MFESFYHFLFAFYFYLKIWQLTQQTQAFSFVLFFVHMWHCDMHGIFLDPSHGFCVCFISYFLIANLIRFGNETFRTFSRIQNVLFFKFRTNTLTICDFVSTNRFYNNQPIAQTTLNKLKLKSGFSWEIHQMFFG